jgi:hypothetical protein
MLNKTHQPFAMRDEGLPARVIRGALKKVGKAL